jgi:DNA modification methylase
MIVSVSLLTHHPLNETIYSLSDIDDLKQNIKEIGLLHPLVINSKNQVISGNRRFQSIKELGWETVEVKVQDIEDEDIPLYIVSYNKHRIKTVKEQLSEIKILQKYYSKGKGYRSDLTSANIGKGSSRMLISNKIGISSGQIQKLIFIDNNKEEFIPLIDKGIMTVNQAYLECQRVIKVKSSTDDNNIKTKKNQEIRNVQLYNKSSKNMDEISDGQVQLIFTSPPYWNKRVYSKMKGIGNEVDPDEYVDNLVFHLDDCYRVLNQRGSFFLNLGDTFLNGNLLNIPHKVSIKLQTKGWILRNTIIWKKTNPKPSSSKSNLTPTYEFIFHFVKQLDYKYTLIKSPLSKNTKSSHPPRHRNLNGESNINYSPYIPSNNGKNMGDYWNEDIIMTSVANQKSSFLNIEHPAPFPKEIVTLPLLQTTEENDIVLDPFCGISTVGKVSILFGRKFIGYDTQKKFIQASFEELTRGVKNKSL